MTAGVRDAPLVVGVIDSGVHAAHPHIGALAGGVGVTRTGDVTDDTVDRLGHGTAVAAAIQDLAPSVAVYVVKVFDRTLDTSVRALVAAIDWVVDHRVPLVNLSLGSADRSRIVPLARAVARARATGTVIVAAGEADGVAWLPGTLDGGGLIRTELDWAVTRGRYRVLGPPAAPIFRTSGFPRPIPGVDPARNLKGLSFAVAGMTGMAAQIMIDTQVRGVDDVIERLVRRASC